MARRLAGSAALVLVEAATPLRPEPALFDAMIEGWCRQHSARRLSPTITKARVSVVRRFQAFSGGWPWQWTPERIEAWVAQGEWAHSTIRAYQGSLALFMDYICDARYGWVEACIERVGAAPTQICHEWNTAVHVADYEGDPRRRPLTREELQAFFDAADDCVDGALSAGRKGALATFRDAVLFKVIYAWGLRRREAAMLETVDFSANPAAPELGRLGVCHVRWGKAMKGSPPRRRSVATLMPWAAEALEQYLAEVRPLYSSPGTVLWPTERGGRISLRQVDDRFAQFRLLAGLPTELTVHCMRHAYVSHLTEDGVDPVFIQHQVGHSWPSTLAIYTSIGSDHKQRMLKDALGRVYGPVEIKEGQQR